MWLYVSLTPESSSPCYDRDYDTKRISYIYPRSGPEYPLFSLHVHLHLSFFPRVFLIFFSFVITISFLLSHHRLHFQFEPSRSLVFHLFFSLLSLNVIFFTSSIQKQSIMKSVTAALAAGLATLAAASPNQYQESECVGTATKTVTVTDTYQSGEYSSPPYNGQYTPGAPSAITVTVAGSASTVTLTNSVTVTKTVKYGSSDASITSNGATYTHSAPSTYASSSPVYSNTTTAHASRQTHHVQVGTFDGKVQFIPNNVNAEIGDLVLYDFLKMSHSLTQSEFLTPCTYNGGFDTNLNQVNPQNISGLFVIPFEVTTKKPQWFYCKQQGPPNHCGKGMVFGLNPGNKMDQFIQNAINQNGHLNNATSTTVVTAPSTSSTSTTTDAVATVTVGLMNGTVLRFDPPYLPKVSIGQKIHFDFRAANHTLTESSLNDPCKKLAGTTVDTNFQNVNNRDIPELKPFDLVIDSDKPRFFYCKQQNLTPRGHCGKGMVFSINTDGTTFSQFQQNALATKPTLPKIKGRTVA